MDRLSFLNQQMKVKNLYLETLVKRLRVLISMVKVAAMDSGLCDLILDCLLNDA